MHDALKGHVLSLVQSLNISHSVADLPTCGRYMEHLTTYSAVKIA